MNPETCIHSHTLKSLVRKSLFVAQTGLTLATLLASQLAFASRSPSTGRNSDTASTTQGKERTATTANCRKQALKLHRAGILDRPAFRQRLKQCQTSDPLAEQRRNCKQQYLLAVKSGDAKARARLQRSCRRLEQVGNFDGTDTAPLWILDHMVVFAGVPLRMGLNSVPENLGPFACAQARGAVVGSVAPDFLFFGLSVSRWPELEKIEKTLRWKSLARAGGGLGKDEQGQHVADLPSGLRIYPSTNNPPRPPWTAYLPHTSCAFSGSSDSATQVAKIFGLVHATKQRWQPYLGAQFFRERGAPQMQKLWRQMQSILGKSYASQDGPNGIRWLTKVPLTEFDGEGDPKGLCSPPRPGHDLVVGAKAAANSPEMAEYLLVADIPAYCRSLDILASPATK